jgi:hypothetical protein
VPKFVLLPLDLLVIVPAALAESVKEVLHENVILEVLRLLPRRLLRGVLPQWLALHLINLLEFPVGVISPLGDALHEARDLFIALCHLDHLVRQLSEEHHVALVHLRSRSRVCDVP